jgi:hypothetical protein
MMVVEKILSSAAGDITLLDGDVSASYIFERRLNDSSRPANPFCVALSKPSYWMGIKALT